MAMARVQWSMDAARSAPDWLYWRLCEHAAGGGNAQALAAMIASQRAGAGALPECLGLAPAVFEALMAYHFPGVGRGCKSAPGACQDGAPANPVARAEEASEVERLLLNDRAGQSISEVWMARIIAVACLGGDHLWQDLGLWRRADLSALMTRNFPALAARNVRDMKWKRFLYKQLCAAEGLFVCRAPSCNHCVDYHACFGPEN